MSAGLMGIVGLIYVGVTIALIFEGRPGMALAFAGYAIAQVGLIWEVM